MFWVLGVLAFFVLLALCFLEDRFLDEECEYWIKYRSRINYIH